MLKYFLIIVYWKKETQIPKEVFYLEKINGFEENSSFVLFDKQKLLKNHITINYLYGQLYSIHHLAPKVDPKLLAKKYNEEYWTQNGGVLTELLHLGYSAGLFTPIVKDNNGITTTLSNTILPTLSPNDPNFPEWWEKHKVEWETRKKPDGQEPFED